MTSLVSVASYNTSWLGDYGKPNDYASEKHLFADLFNDEKQRDKRRTYFKNAIGMVMNFWDNEIEKGNSVVIGFQEMNNRTAIRDQKKPDETEIDQIETENFQGGTDYIIDQFKNKYKTEDAFNDHVKWEQHFVHVNYPTVVPGLLIIWTPSLGNLVHTYKDDLNFTLPGTTKSQKGRPIMIVFTSNKYILINLHGPNFPEESMHGPNEPNMKSLRENIQEHLNKAIEEYNAKNQSQPINDLNSYNIFIMGDFNDPYNSIHPDRPLMLKEKEYCYSNKNGSEGDAPRTCCYNFNSACSDDLFNFNKDIKNLTKTDTESIQKLIDYKPELGDTLERSNNKECIVINNTDSTRKQGPGIGPTISAKSLGDRGKISNYRFTGDYVMGLKDNIVQPLQIYRNNSNEISKESDHEMVYAIFSVSNNSTVGGKKYLLKNKKRNKKTSKSKKIKNIKKTSKSKKIKNIKKTLKRKKKPNFFL